MSRSALTESRVVVAVAGRRGPSLGRQSLEDLGGDVSGDVVSGLEDDAAVTLIGLAVVNRVVEDGAGDALQTPRAQDIDPPPCGRHKATPQSGGGLHRRRAEREVVRGHDTDPNGRVAAPLATLEDRSSRCLVAFALSDTDPTVALTADVTQQSDIAGRGRASFDQVGRRQ